MVHDPVKDEPIGEYVDKHGNDIKEDEVAKKQMIYGISTLEGGVVFDYPTHQGNRKKALFSTEAKAQAAIDKYLDRQFINDFIVCLIGERVDLITEDE